MSRFWILVRRTGILAVTLFVLQASGLEAGDSPWYVDAKVGKASVEATLGTRHSKIFDSDETTTSVGFGFRLTDYVALEIGLHDFGEVSGFGSPCPDNVDACIEKFALCSEGTSCTEVLTRLGADLTGLSLTVVPRWPVTDRVAVYGKLGVIDWEADISGLYFGGTNESFSDKELLAGAGVRYDFERDLGVLLEYEQFDLKLDRLTLGIGWAF